VFHGPVDYGLVGAIVGGVGGLGLLRFVYAAWWRRRAVRGMVARGEARPSSAAVPDELLALGLAEPLRIGDAIGARGVLGGVEATAVCEPTSVGGEPSHQYTLGVRLVGVTLGRERVAGALACGDAELDAAFVVGGPIEEIATRLDVAARRALVAAAQAGWRPRGARLVAEGVARSELEPVMRVGVRAAAALLVHDEPARLGRTAARDPATRMRRRALAVLLGRHAGAAETRAVKEALGGDGDAIIRWLLMRGDMGDDAWLGVAANLLMDATRVDDACEALLALRVTEALPAIGQALRSAPEAGARSALERCKAMLTALAERRGRGAAGALAVVDEGGGRLSLDE